LAVWAIAASSSRTRTLFGQPPGVAITVEG
jgi:hypothetical protein